MDIADTMTSIIKWPEGMGDKPMRFGRSNHSDPAKRATNITVNESLLTKAKELDINVSRASEAGIARAVAEKLAASWLKDNKAALDSSNAYVEKHGLPLAKYRPF